MRNIIQLTKDDLIYAASFIDGEGSINICWVKHNSVMRGGWYSLTVRVNVTYKPVLIWFLKLFQGNVCEPTIRPHQNKHNFAWQVSGPTAARFLAQILPYLKEKKLQAEVALLFQSLKKHTYKGNGLTEEEFQLQQSCAEVVKLLHNLDGDIGRICGNVYNSQFIN